ncbi:MAG: ChaN family lipoprotein [Alphaproteobacteria bacterium]
MRGLSAAVATSLVVTPVLAADASSEDLPLADHPLVDTIVRVADGAELSFDELAAALAEARFVVIGEKHDNRRHHVIQAELVEQLGRAGGLEAVAFEMLPRDTQIDVTAHVQNGGNAAGLAQAVGWSELGWGPWTWYGPIADAALRHGATIVAADLSRDEARAVYEDGFDALDGDFVARTGLDQPLAEAERTARVEAMVEAHCGHDLGPMADSMVQVQRARDAMLADRLATLTGDGQGVLIAGNGHAVTDQGAPVVLARLAPDAETISVGLAEVRPEWDDVPDRDFAHDYVWFTPRAKPVDFDYCERFDENRG